MSLKRLWDTENQKIVWAVDQSDPRKVYQVWTNDDGSKLYVYKNSKRVELDQTVEDVKEYGSYWKELDDEMVGYYLTSEPTNLYNWDEGDEVSYVFKDWDGTVLKEGKVDEGTAPTPPADPTRAATAQYTYTFAGWNPTVGPISKRTTFTATYTATVNQYTATIASEDTSKGTVDDDSVTADYGTAISANGKVLTIGENTVTATAETGYEFSSWGELPETLTADVTITATFEATMIPVESISDLPTDVSGVAGSTYSYYFTYSPNDASDVENQITIVSGNDSIATVSSTSVDNGYFYVNYSCVAAGTTTFTHYINGVSAGTTTVTIDALVPVQSISQPSSLSVSVQQGQTDTSITMDYLPTNANDFSNVSFNIDDSTIAGVWANSISSGTMTLAIQGLSEGTTDIHAICGEDDYTIAVTVTAPL